MKAYSPRLGKRGKLMILLALLYIWTAVRVILAAPEANDELIHTMWPVWFRVTEWTLPSAVALVFAWRMKDWPGWVALLIPPMIRAVSYIYGGIVWAVSEGTKGYLFGPWDAVLYLFLIGIVLLGASWPDYPPRARPPAPGVGRGGVIE